MKITAEIRAALDRALEHYGNTAQLAKEIGVAHSTVYFWAMGRTENISGKLWNTRVRPVLEPFREPPQAMELREPAPLQVYQSSPGPSQEIQSRSAERRKVPLIAFETFKNFDPANASLKRFVRMKQLEYVNFACPYTDGGIAVRLGRDLPGLFIAGTDLLLASGDYPGSGCCVLARLQTTGEVVFARFLRDGSRIRLHDMLTDRVIDAWDSSVSIGRTLWMYPVLEARRDFSEGLDFITEEGDKE